jgi:hypothetical protein
MSVLNWSVVSMPVVYWWLPLMTDFVGLGVCLFQGLRKRSIGLLLLGLMSAESVALKLLTTYMRPDLWTAPAPTARIIGAVVHPALFLLAVILVARRVSKPQAIA